MGANSFLSEQPMLEEIFFLKILKLEKRQNQNTREIA